MKFTWREEASKMDWRDIMEAFGIHGLIAKVLAKRMGNLEEVKAFLKGEIGDLIPSSLLPGVEPAAKRIIRAIKHGERILIHGDYDTDGVTGLALLYRNLRRLGAEPIPYIPDRFTEGYGLSAEAVKRAREIGATLIVTVDCGITGIEEAQLAKKYGIDLIITDHHEPGPELPEALALVNPRVGNYPFRELAGVGVAFKLAGELYRKLGEEISTLLWDLDLVAIGTVADVAPVVGENRLLVRAGLRVLERTLKAGLKALKRTARLRSHGGLSPWHISFILAPRLNAAGRLSSAYKSFQLLTETRGARAMAIAQELERENSERQAIERRILTEAGRMLREQEGRFFMVGYSQSWHEGVIGIAASRLVDQYYRPVALIAVKNGRARGSVRSIPGFHVQKALTMMADLFWDYGGHPMAGGFSMDPSKIPELVERAERIARDHLSPESLVPPLLVDAEITFDELSVAFFRDYARMEPFGFGNPQPVFVVRGARVLEVSSSPFTLRVEQEGTEAVLRSPDPHPSWSQIGPGNRVNVAIRVEDVPLRRGVLQLRLLDVEKL